MKLTKLYPGELNKRAAEVFDLRPGDHIYTVAVKDDGTVVVAMCELTEDGEPVDFDYLPDMSERPEALAYLLGERDNFND